MDVQHWGIKVIDGGWVTDDSGIIFAVTSKAVAEAQLEILMNNAYRWGRTDYEVREIK